MPTTLSMQGWLPHAFHTRDGQRGAGGGRVHFLCCGEKQRGGWSLSAPCPQLRTRESAHSWEPPSPWKLLFWGGAQMVSGKEERGIWGGVGGGERRQSPGREAAEPLS